MKNNINTPDSREAIRDWGGENLSTCNKQVNGKTHSSEYCAMNNCDMSLTNNLISGLKMDFLEIKSEYFANKMVEEIIKDFDKLIIKQLGCQPSKDVTKSDTEEPTNEVLEEGYLLSQPVLSVIDTRQNRRKQARENEKACKALKSNTANVGTLACMLVTLNWVYEYITSNEDAEVSTFGLRKLKTNLLACLPSKDSPEYPSKYDEAKKQWNDYKCDHLKGVPFSFIGGYRKTEYLIRHTGLFMIDTDDLENDYPDLESQEERLREVRELMKNDPLLKTVLIFVSPTGRGLKWCVWHDIYAELRKRGIDNPNVNDINKMHTRIYMAICNYLKVSYGLTADTNCKDLPHLHLLPHDPDCYYNPNFLEQQTQAFDVDYWHDFRKEETNTGIALPDDYTRVSGVTELPNTTLLTDAQVDETIRRLELIGGNLTDDYDDWLENIGFALAASFGNSARNYFHRLSRLSTKYDYDECDRKWNGIVRDANGQKRVGSFFHWAEKLGINHQEVCKYVYQKTNEQIFYGDMNTSKYPKYPNTHSITQKEEISNNNSNILYINKLNKNNANIESSETTRGNGDIGDFRRAKIEMTFSQNIAVIGLPIIFREISEYFDDNPQRCDIALHSALTQMLPCLPNVYFVHDNRPHYPSSYFYLEAPSGGGKNLASTAGLIIAPLEEQKQKEFDEVWQKYKTDKALWEAKGKRLGEPEPECPLGPKIKVDGNISSAALILYMKANGGFIVFNESEAETIVKMKGNSWSQYSDIFRKGLSNETISSSRATKELNTSIDDPRIGIVIAGQPSVTGKLFNNSGIGDIQRIVSYNAAREERTLENRFGRSENKKLVNELFKELSEIFLNIYNQLNNHATKIELALTKDQYDKLFEFQNDAWNEFGDAFGDAVDGKLVRLPIEMLNIVLIMSLFYRYEERLKENKPLFEDFEQSLTADERAIEISLRMMEILMRHTSSIWQKHGWTKSCATQTFTNNLTVQQMEFYQTVPENFTRKEWNETSTVLGIPTKTSEKWLSTFETKYQIITKVKHGEYRKCRP